MLQTNNTGVHSQCLSHTGSAPAHGACSLPAHTARALGCSAGNNPRPALGSMHLPGPSRSGSGTWVVLRGADSVRPAFCALPIWQNNLEPEQCGQGGYTRRERGQTQCG